MKAADFDDHLTFEALGRALPALAASTRVWRNLDGHAFIKRHTREA